MEQAEQSWWDSQIIFNKLRLLVIRQRHARELRDYLANDSFVEGLLHTLEVSGQLPERHCAMRQVEQWLLEDVLRYYKFESTQRLRQIYKVMKEMWSLLYPILMNSTSDQRVRKTLHLRQSSPSPLSPSSLPQAQASDRSHQIHRVQPSIPSMPSITPQPQVRQPHSSRVSMPSQSQARQWHASRASMPSLTALPSQAHRADVYPGAHSYTSISSMVPPPMRGGHSVASLEHIPGFHPDTPKALWAAPEDSRPSQDFVSFDSFPRTPMTVTPSRSWEATSGSFSPPEEPFSREISGFPVGTSSSSNLSAHPSGVHDAAASLLSPGSSAGWKSNMPSPEMRPVHGWWYSPSIINSVKLRLLRKRENKALNRWVGSERCSENFLAELERAARFYDCEEAQLHVYAWLVEEQARIPDFEARDMWAILNPILQSYADALMNPKIHAMEEQVEPEKKVEEEKSETQEEFQRILTTACHHLKSSLFQKKKEPR